MIVKLCFNNEIHRVSKPLANFQALRNAIELTFKGQLPAIYSIQYLDADGDKVMISNDEDYKAMFGCIPKGTKSVKVYVVSIDESEVSFRKDNSEIMSKSGFSVALDQTKNEEKISIIDTNSEKSEVKEPAQQEEVEDKVKEMVENALFQQIPSISLLVKDFLAEGQVKKEKEQPKKPQQQKPVHRGIICDGCEMNPIVGVRYKCAVSDDFDLCEDCEAKMNHPYPMLKIKDPKYHPVALMCAFNEDIPKNFNPRPFTEANGSRMPSFVDMAAEQYSKLGQHTKVQLNNLFKGIPEKLEKAINHLKPQQPPKKQEESKKVEENIYSFQFIKEISTIPSKITVKDLVLYKTITIKNNGTAAWPKNTCLIPEQKFMGQKAVLIPLQPNKEMSVVLVIDSPREPGKYVSNWKMCQTEGDKVIEFPCDTFKVEFEICDPNAKAQVQYAPLEKKEQAPKKVVIIDAPKKEEPKKKVSQETPMGYSDEIVKKVKQLKDIFNDADVTFLLDYVKNSAELQLEELVEGYLALQESKPKEEPKKVEETPKGDECETPNGETPDGETPRGFTEEVVKKVKDLKIVFPEGDVAVLLDFVNNSGDMSIEELIDNYLEMCQESEAFFDSKKEVVEEKKPEEPKYPKEVLEMAKQMKEILSETELGELCEFVTKSKENLTLNDLIEAFLQ